MAEQYFYQEYPKYLFTKEGGYVLVHNEEDEGKQTGAWKSSLLELGIETCPQAQAIQPMAQLIPGFYPPPPAPVPPADEEEGSSGGRY